jgi:hypothetical protein
LIYNDYHNISDDAAILQAEDSFVGVIFGINTSVSDKIRIKNTLLKNNKDCVFWQAKINENNEIFI